MAAVTKLPASASPIISAERSNVLARYTDHGRWRGLRSFPAMVASRQGSGREQVLVHRDWSAGQRRLYLWLPSGLDETVTYLLKKNMRKKTKLYSYKIRNMPIIYSLRAAHILSIILPPLSYKVKVINGCLNAV